MSKKNRASSMSESKSVLLAKSDFSLLGCIIP